MREIDPGHIYELDHLDGDGVERLTFVKREGANYPGNIGHYEGTNMQEVIRALIARMKYVNCHIRSSYNAVAINSLRMTLFALEERAAFRHGRTLSINDHLDIEDVPTCLSCGHIECGGGCKREVVVQA